MNRNHILDRDKQFVWHPYTDMAAYKSREPIVAARARGSHFWDKNGKRYIDGNSSWWTQSLGHKHPRLIKAAKKQLDKLPHISLAGITHEAISLLSEELLLSAPAGFSHVFYTDNGSTAIEAALKMAVQYWRQCTSPKPEKTRFIALDGAFHGETLGCSSLGGIEVFRRPFASLLLDCIFVPFPSLPSALPPPSPPSPLLSPAFFHASGANFGGERPPLSSFAEDIPDETQKNKKREEPKVKTEEQSYAYAFQRLRQVIESAHDEIAAVVIEPLVQGASGMRMYSANYLRDLRELCKAKNVLIIVDEVFTGYGRTGTMWASEQAKLEHDLAPDFMCIGKTFSSFLPMAAVLTRQTIYEAFLDGKERSFFYGHSFCGNPLGASLAREVLAIFRDENLMMAIQPKIEQIKQCINEMKGLKYVHNARSKGMIGAVDLGLDSFQSSSRYLGQLGWLVYEEALKKGAYLRPLGDTVYLTPPLTISEETLSELLSIMYASIDEVGRHL